MKIIYVDNQTRRLVVLLAHEAHRKLLNGIPGIQTASNWGTLRLKCTTLMDSRASRLRHIKARVHYPKHLVIYLQSAVSHHLISIYEVYNRPICVICIFNYIGKNFCHILLHVPVGVMNKIIFKYSKKHGYHVMINCCIMMLCGHIYRVYIGLYCGTRWIRQQIQLSLTYCTCVCFFVRFQQALADSFADLKRMSWLNAMSMLVRNLLYPFRRFGFLGCVVCFLVYPILIPLSFIFCFIYSIPVVYLSCRVVRHIFTGHKPTLPSQRHRKRRSAFNEMVHAFEADTVVKYLKKNKKG